ncbi:MAG: orotidine-5'-phosphate decarboxylase [Planctomycetes bacterium]|nr:orotidine-5'-phosphate decarboxylase [Planctomycetota bacterium]
MKNFADRLIAEIEAKGTPAIVGIDPRLELLPLPVRRKFDGSKRGSLRSLVAALKAFSCEIVDIVAPHVPAVKPQVAFFEMYGWVGLQAYAEVVRYAKRAGLVVIGDVKRGDIGSTALAYARGHLGQVAVSGRLVGMWQEDAVTVNPYLGGDSIEPFLLEVNARGKGIFVLVRTSNPSGEEIQNLDAGGSPVYLHVARLVAGWGKDSIGVRGFSSVGAVVGATCPQEAGRIRQALPETIFLVPGYGAQGATAEDIRPAFRQDGLGAVVNSSRGIIFAYRRSPYSEQFGDRRWQEAVEAAVKAMKKDLAAIYPGGGE